MLSDDISNGIGSILSGAGRLISGAVRGAILFGLIGIAACATLGAIGGLIGLGGAGLLSGMLIGLSIHGVSWAIGGAAIGAAVLGVTSLIPSIGGIKGLFSSPAPSMPQVTPPDLGQSQSIAHARAAMPEMENPYYKEGLGAEILNRQQAQGTAQGASRIT